MTTIRQFLLSIAIIFAAAGLPGEALARFGAAARVAPAALSAADHASLLQRQAGYGETQLALTNRPTARAARRPAAAPAAPARPNSRLKGARLAPTAPTGSWIEGINDGAAPPAWAPAVRASENLTPTRPPAVVILRSAVLAPTDSAPTGPSAGLEHKGTRLTVELDAEWRGPLYLR